jgi:uncharacterized repeat protein (TIGR01451 family)
MTGLDADTYDNINVTLAGCTSNSVMATLTDPDTITITLEGLKSPSTCGGNDGTIQIGSLIPSTNYTLNFDKDGTPQSAQNIASNISGEYILSGLEDGVYSNIKVTLSGCTSNALMATLTDPTPTSCLISGDMAVSAGSSGNSYSGPAGMSNYTWSISGSGSIIGATNTQSISVTAGASGSFTLTLDITDTNNCTSSCMKTVTVGSVIDLSLNKKVDNITAQIGDTVTFSLIVHNDGPSTATGIQVTDQLPTGFSYISDDGSGDYAANIWMVNDLIAGERDTLKIMAEVLGSGDYTNQAEITSANEPDIDSDPSTSFLTDDLTDGISDDDEDEVVIDPTIIFDLSLDKHLAVGQTNMVDIGDDINYTIVISNEGDITAKDIEICDLIPAGLVLSPLDTNTWTGTSPDTLYQMLVVPILPGSSDSVNIVLRVAYGASGSSIRNIAEIYQDSDADGNGVIDNDSEPFNGDMTEDDIADEEIILLNHDPTGYFYCEKSGKIVTGGTITVTGPSGIGNDPTEVNLISDGSSGFYEWYAIGPVGTYSISYSHPDGHTISIIKTPTGPSFDPTGFPNPYELGSDTLGMYLADTAFANNPYYLNFVLEPFDPAIHFNNIPLNCVLIGSIVCEDDNANDMNDGSEPGLANVIIRLYDCADTINPIDTTITNVNGEYRFDGLPAGNYRLQFVTPAGYRFLTANADTVSADGFTSCVTLNLGDCDTSKTVCFTPLLYDFGDLPDLTASTANGDYQTLFANNGPSHRIISGLMFGVSIDHEPDGLQSTAADGDGVDEDGFSFPTTLSLRRNITIRRPLDITNTTGIVAHLEGWIDWNGDGDFDDPNEMIVDLSDDGAGNFGVTRISFTVPSDAAQNQALGVRFRLSQTDNMTPYGQVESGEIEDYLISVGCPLEQCLPTSTKINLGTLNN